MPLLDHFHPPLSIDRHWPNMHSAWANALRDQLNEGVLPPRYFAEVEVQVGQRVEVDVGALEAGGAAGYREEGAVGVAVWAPPRPTQTVPLNFTHPDIFEVQVYNDEEGPRLVAAVELISPANKDRPGNRHMFAVKCASCLYQKVGLVLVDVVTNRDADLHAELLQVLEAAPAPPRSELYAGAYRTVSTEQGFRLEYWLEALRLGSALPTLPLWIAPDRCVPLDLGSSYETACRRSRIN